MANLQYDPEEFARLFDAALAEADRAARLAKPGFGAARNQAPLVAVDHYVERLMDEIAELRAYRDQVNAWFFGFPMSTANLTATAVSLEGEVDPWWTDFPRPSIFDTAIDGGSIESKLVSREDGERFNAELLSQVRPPTLD